MTLAAAKQPGTPAALQRHMSATENIAFLLFGPNIPQAEEPVEKSTMRQMTLLKEQDGLRHGILIVPLEALSGL